MGAAGDPLQEEGLSPRDAADLAARRGQVPGQGAHRHVPRALGDRARLRRGQDAHARS